MNTRYHRYMSAIADQGTITAAAKLLGISPPALSKFLKKQEDLLGVSLFFHHQKQMYLTEAGKVYYQTAQKILTVQDNMLQAIQKRKEDGSRTIRIAIPPNLGFETYNRALHRFSSLFPATNIVISELYSKDQETAIHQNIIDLAFGVSIHESYADVRNIPISKIEILLTMPKHYPPTRLAAAPAGELPSLSLADLSDRSFVLCDQKNNLRKEVDILFKQAGFSPIIVFESTNSLSVEFMLRSGAGIGFVTNRPSVLSDPDPDLAFFHLDPPSYETYHLRCRTDRVLSNEEECLIALYSQELMHVVNSQPVYGRETEHFLATLDRYARGGSYAQDPSRSSADPALVGQVLADLPFPDPSFDTDILRRLIAIVDERSLTKAAEKFYLSQPALSRYLRKTETTLGTPIFVREHNRLRLTEAGAIFINAARSIVGLEETCIRQLQTGSAASTENGISLMVQDIFYPAVSAIILPRWRTSYPDVHLTVTCGTGDQVRNSVPVGRADLYLAFGPSAGNVPYEAFVLGQIPMMLYHPGPPVGHVRPPDDGTDPHAHCRPPLSALPGSPAFLLCRNDIYLRELQEKMLREAGIFKPQIAAEARLSVLVDLLPLGHGSTILPSSAMKKASPEGLHPPDTDYFCECLLVWQKGTRLTPIAKDLIDLFWEQRNAIL